MSLQGRRLSSPTPRECGDRATLAAVQRWFFVPHDRWQNWGELTETIGVDALWDHMEAALAAEPPELVRGVMISPLDDPHEIAFGEKVLGQKGSRVEVIYVHRFGSAEMRSRFLDLYKSGDSDEIARRLFTVGWDSGSDELGA